MTLFKMIKLKLGGKIYSNLAHEMGYQDISTAIDRLHQIESTKNTFEWLKSSGYDLRYSNEEFLVKLCKLLVINDISYTTAIKEAKKRLADLEKMKQPFLVVNTDFQRKGESITTLGYRSHEKRFDFDKEQYLYTNEKDFFDMISMYVKMHYKEHNGRLDFWGKIENYTLFDRYGVSHTFDSDGVKIAEKFMDLFDYIERVKSENRFETNSDEYIKSIYPLLFMIFDKVVDDLVKRDTRYIDRILDKKPTLFSAENVYKYFADMDKNSGLFYENYFRLIVYIELRDELLYLHYMPLNFYGLDDLANKNGFYKRLFCSLHQLTSKDEIFEDKSWTKIPYKDSKEIINVLKMLYVRFIYQTYLTDENAPMKSSSACTILYELYEEKYISEEELEDYFAKFGKIEHNRNNKLGCRNIANRLAKILAKSCSEKSFYREKFIITHFGK